MCIRDRYCYEHYGVQPDVITSAKGLGGGLPIGACLCTERLGAVMGAGMHGSTFGGNPVACAGALAVLKKITKPGFLEQVAQKGDYLREKLAAMDGIEEVRGIGMMLGARLKAVSYTHLVCIILGFVVGAYIQQYVMGPVGGLCVGVIVDEAVYKIRMKRFISKGGIPTKPEKPEEKPAETAEDDAKEKKEKM